MHADHAATHELLTRHYLIFVLAVNVGVLQIATSVSGLRSLWLVDSSRWTRWLGILIVIAAVVIFMLAPVRVEGPWAARSVEADSSTRQWGRAAWGELAGAYNINDEDGGLSGADQATWFPAAFAAALALTLVGGAVRSLLRGMGARGQPRGRGARDGSYGSDGPDGLEGLADCAYPSVLRRSSALFAASWRDDLTREFDPARHRFGVPARLASSWRRK
jgi:hypothetical protein